jgi:hypothetical protein
VPSKKKKKKGRGRARNSSLGKKLNGRSEKGVTNHSEKPKHAQTSSRLSFCLVSGQLCLLEVPTPLGKWLVVGLVSATGEKR